VVSKTVLKSASPPGLSTPPMRVMGVVAHATRTRRAFVVT
jgi:hypothetical protein